MAGSNEPFTLFSPLIPREANEFIPAQELKQRLLEFYTLYNPDNIKEGFIDTYLEFARTHGVLALRTSLKQKYGCNLDEADASEVGWLRIKKKLEEFYTFHVGDKGDRDIERIYGFAKGKGLLALDEKLAEKYGESLSEFTSRGLLLWKSNWKSVLQEHSEESLAYELRRFYTVVQRLPQSFDGSQSMDKLVEWAIKHTRSEVNEKLLKKYNFCLDDVKMVKGNTNQERKVNLKGQLVQFFQQYDPQRLGPDADRKSKNKSPKKRGSFNSSQNGSKFDEDDAISNEMAQIDQMAERGIIYLEELNDNLIRQYGVGLEDEDSAKIRRRLVEYYKELRIPKTPASIEEIVKFALKNGVDALNEKLVLTHGRGIIIEDL